MALFRRRDWVPALGRWQSVEAYRRLMRAFSLQDLPEKTAEDLTCDPGMAVLELGCGPGALASAISQRTNSVRYIGLDPDAAMLAYASKQAPTDAGWVRGLAQQLPFANASFDRVSTTLMLHHLTRQQKMWAISEARRVLRPGGVLLVTDWTKPQGWAALSFLLVRTIDGFAQTADNAEGRLPALIEGAGFEGLKELRRRETCLGTITQFRAIRPKR